MGQSRERRKEETHTQRNAAGSRPGHFQSVSQRAWPKRERLGSNNRPFLPMRNEVNEQSVDVGMRKCPIHSFNFNCFLEPSDYGESTRQTHSLIILNGTERKLNTASIHTFDSSL